MVPWACRQVISSAQINLCNQMKRKDTLRGGHQVLIQPFSVLSIFFYASQLSDHSLNVSFSKSRSGLIQYQHTMASAAISTVTPASVSLPSPLPQSLEWMLSQLHAVDCVCFDVDSTVSCDEGIDVLAEFLGKGEAVKALTNQAMNGAGQLTDNRVFLFQDALRARLNLMQPSLSDVSNCVLQRPPEFTKGFESFVQFLRTADASIGKAPIPVYLVSGGFRMLIDPLRTKLGLREDEVFANRFIFSDDGKYHSFDEQEFTSCSGGKARALSHLQSSKSYSCMMMIGDGMTDVEACPPAKIMVGFGGIVTRKAVQEKAHHFITEWPALQQLFQQSFIRKQATASENEASKVAEKESL